MLTQDILASFQLFSVKNGILLQIAGCNSGISVSYSCFTLEFQVVFIYINVLFKPRVSPT